MSIKPRKLEPLSSRKHSEIIAQLEKHLDITQLPTETILARSLEKRPYDNYSNEKVEDNYVNYEAPLKSNETPVIENVTDPFKGKAETKKTKKVKKKKKVIKKVELGANAEPIINEVIDSNNKKDDKIVRISKFAVTEEMPTKTIDYIWDVNRLNLLLEDATQCLGSIKEELPIT